MTSMERHGAGMTTRGLGRQVGREVARINGGATVDIARTEGRTQIQAAKVDGLTAVTQRALQGAAYITNVEMALAEACPAAMTRLKLIGDTGTMALGGIVMDTAFALRSI